MDPWLGTVTYDWVPHQLRLYRNPVADDMDRIAGVGDEYASLLKQCFVPLQLDLFELLRPSSPSTLARTTPTEEGQDLFLPSNVRVISVRTTQPVITERNFIVRSTADEWVRHRAPPPSISHCTS